MNLTTLENDEFSICFFVCHSLAKNITFSMPGNRGGGDECITYLFKQSVLASREVFSHYYPFFKSIWNCLKKTICFLYPYGQGWEKSNFLGFVLSDIILYELIIVVCSLLLNVDSSFKEIANHFSGQGANTCKLKLCYKSDRILLRRNKNSHIEHNISKHLSTIGKRGGTWMLTSVGPYGSVWAEVCSRNPTHLLKS